MVQDPPFLPFSDSHTWFESGPDAVSQNFPLATLVARIGMAANALDVQAAAGVASSGDSYSGAKARGIVVSLVTSAALMTEALRLAQENMAVLRQLAMLAGIPDEILREMGKLASGNHVVSGLLTRARNKVGFHWDADTAGIAVADFATNQRLVWLESDSDGRPIHRFGFEVMVHSLFPPSAPAAGSSEHMADVKQQMAALGNAMEVVTHFFTACTYGYLKQINAMKKTAASPAT